MQNGNRYYNNYSSITWFCTKSPNHFKLFLILACNFFHWRSQRVQDDRVPKSEGKLWDFNFIVWNHCGVHYSKSVPAFWFYWKRAVLEKVCNTSQLPTEDDPTQLMHGMQFWEKADCKMFQWLCAAATAGFACERDKSSTVPSFMWLVILVYEYSCSICGSFHYHHSLIPLLPHALRGFYPL